MDPSKKKNGVKDSCRRNTGNLWEDNQNKRGNKNELENTGTKIKAPVEYRVRASGTRPEPSKWHDIEKHCKTTIAVLLCTTHNYDKN